MGNTHFSVMWRGKALSDEQRNCIMGQAGEKRTSQSRSKIYRQNQHYSHETLLWSCENSKYGSVEIQNMALHSLCFWSTAQIFLGSRIEQPESFLGLSFPYVYAPLGFTTCPSSCQCFLVASGVIKIGSVHLVTCRSPALASMVKAAADHTSELLFSAL